MKKKRGEEKKKKRKKRRKAWKVEFCMETICVWITMVLYGSMDISLFHF